MLPTEETTATEVYLHAADHGDRPVIHGAEIDYDDIHDGVHYHADLLKAAQAEYDRALAAMYGAADKVAIRAMLADEHAEDPREYGSGWAEEVAGYTAARVAWFAASDRTQALRAKRDQDAAMATYAVDSTTYTLPDGRTVIGKDAYEAEVVKAVFGA